MIMAIKNLTSTSILWISIVAPIKEILLGVPNNFGTASHAYNLKPPQV